MTQCDILRFLINEPAPVFFRTFQDPTSSPPHTTLVFILLFPSPPRRPPGTISFYSDPFILPNQVLPGTFGIIFKSSVRLSPFFSDLQKFVLLLLV